MHYSAIHCYSLLRKDISNFYLLLLRDTVCLVLYIHRIQLIVVLYLLKDAVCLCVGTCIHTGACTHTPSMILAFSIRGISKKVQLKTLSEALETIKETA